MRARAICSSSTATCAAPRRTGMARTLYAVCRFEATPHSTIKGFIMGRINGKVSVILGAAGEGNMGQVIARRFAGEGARVIVAGRTEATLRPLPAELGGGHGACDITRSADVEHLANFAVQRFGAL